MTQTPPAVHRFLITGGPGAGKTAFLAELTARGYRTRGDSAREIIARRRAVGLSPRLSSDVSAEQVLAEDMSKDGALAGEASTETVFFERGVPDALGMAFEAGAVDDAQVRVMLARFPYERTALVLRPWEAIYVQDTERDQSYAEAVAVYGKVLRWYAWCGFTVHEVPRMPVPERAAYVLSLCAESVA